MSRIEQIQKMLLSDPEDLVLNYALAMELLGAGRAEESLQQFDKVIALHPAYSAAYMQKAKALLGLQRHEDARCLLEAGIQVAAGRGDQHAKDKMEELLRAIR